MFSVLILSRFITVKVSGSLCVSFPWSALPAAGLPETQRHTAAVLGKQGPPRPPSFAGRILTRLGGVEQSQLKSCHSTGLTVKLLSLIVSLAYRLPSWKFHSLSMESKYRIPWILVSRHPTLLCPRLGLPAGRLVCPFPLLLGFSLYSRCHLNKVSPPPKLRSGDTARTHGRRSLSQQWHFLCGIRLASGFPGCRVGLAPAPSSCPSGTLARGRVCHKIDGSVCSERQIMFLR